ncbi:hypothetical protein D1AOALGA4SA_3360 [Olavius algarvensis Delta 1 endosymbiont]|nr:hypothetical protein D1AOALGA4SA_3360 [Olavius algarvensis Delta 1 endosymbiont]
MILISYLKASKYYAKIIEFKEYINRIGIRIDIGFLSLAEIELST